MSTIYSVILREIEEHLPIDFGCACSYEPAQERLSVACVGVRSRPASLELGLQEGAPISVDENGLSRCIRGKLVYEPDVGGVEFPFPQRLGLQEGAPISVAAQTPLSTHRSRVVSVHDRLGPRPSPGAELPRNQLGTRAFLSQR